MLIVAVMLVNMTPVQNYIAKKVTETLAGKLKTTVALKHIRIDFLDHIVVEGLYIAGQAHDTLLYAGEADVKFSDWFILRNERPLIRYVGLRDAYVHLYRTKDKKTWNFDFITDAFQTTGKKDTSKKKKEFEIDLKQVNLQQVRFHMDDAWGGSDMNYDVGKLALNISTLDFKKKLLDINNIDIDNTNVIFNDYIAGKPRDTTVETLNLIDTTPFNPDKWVLSCSRLSLKQCGFYLTSSDVPSTPAEFDPSHIYVKNINIDANHIIIAGDTLHGSLNNLTGQERSGIQIKKMKATVTVSPNASICDNLYLETNNSRLYDHYAMLYTRFPDFTSYITNVVMDVRLKGAIVDERDIAYFAPALRRLPLNVVHVSGTARGTVANLGAKDLQITDGFTKFKGDIKMVGLPDIYKTYITYTNGEIITTGGDLLKYAPSLKSNHNIALDKIVYASFNGSFAGYIENFAVNGLLKTNMGTVTTNIKMQAPDFKSSTIAYTGKIAGDNIALGALFYQPMLGEVSFNASVSGVAFDPDNAQVTIDANINNFSFNGYNYKNIYAQGKLARRQFKGNLLVNDSNLALAFYGGLDFSQKLVSINAKANLLKSNFNALHFTADTVLAVADFDLDCTGSNIDNFSGFAKLYNLDIKRNQHRLDIDSVYINSAEDNNGKILTVNSNDITASINGHYQLTKLPASVQYYLSRYLPDYIKIPIKEAPDQNLTFDITTRRIDSLLGVLTPFIRGFDSARISGSLNTAAKKLSVHAAVPYGAIGAFHMNNVNISGDGNLSLLELNTTIDNVAIGDSLINGSLSVTATLGNDSLNFNIATVSPDANGSVTLNGQILAHRDSLLLTLLPSQFYISQTKWNIAGGSHVVYSDKYLLIKDLELQSGLQKITVNSENENVTKSILIKTENIDLGQLGSWAGLAAYQPDGRLNGTVRVNDVFKNLQIIADMKATGVMLGADTIGNIIIAGAYDKNKKLINLDPQTGIYLGNATLVVSGNISFDSTKHENLNGKLQFTNAPAAWTSPFLIGFMSHLKGSIFGTINIDGTSDDPDISGTVSLKDAGMKIDFLGTSYTVPSANVVFSNNRIELGQVTLYDSYKNTATLTGHFSHNNFKNMRMRLSVKTPKFEVFNLHDFDNSYFYGDLICGVDSLVIGGPFNNINVRIVNALPAAKSHIFIPISSSANVGTYSYVSFKNYGKTQNKIKYKNKDKLNITIDANLNDLATLTLVMDPATGDAINARGSGHIQMQIPANNDVRMYGIYTIDDGDYSFTFKQVAIHRRFLLNSGSTIQFNGPFTETSMNVDATFTTKTRLYDLLSDAEKTSGILGSELSDAQTPQEVDVLLHMNGSLKDPKLTFNIDLPDKRSIGTYAYTKLQRINQDDRQLFDQVASLLLVYDFIPPEGVGSSAAVTGALNNVSQILSSTASSQLTNLVNKITGNKDLSLDLRYVNYNLSDPTLGSGLNRNQLTVNVRKNYLNDRLIVEIGSTSDWGRQATTSTSNNFNLAGDFRIQYLLTPAGTLRLNAFRTSDYDVTLDRNINRAGGGLSWRKSFDGLQDFVRGNKYMKKQAQKALQFTADSSTGKKTAGTQ